MSQTNKHQVPEQFRESVTEIYNVIQDALIELNKKRMLSNAEVYSAFMSHLMAMGVPRDMTERWTEEFSNYLNTQGIRMVNKNEIH